MLGRQASAFQTSLKASIFRFQSERLIGSFVGKGNSSTCRPSAPSIWFRSTRIDVRVPQVPRIWGPGIARTSPNVLPQQTRRPSRVFLIEHALRPSRPRRLRPHHLHGLRRHRSLRRPGFFARAPHRPRRACSRPGFRSSAFASSSLFMSRPRPPAHFSKASFTQIPLIPPTKFSSALAAPMTLASP